MKSILIRILRMLSLRLSDVKSPSNRYSVFKYDKSKKLFDSNERSQYGQDWLVVRLFPDGSRFFFEAGVIDGVLNSNTYLLEKSYNWSGIVCEPSKKWHPELFKNRTCSIETSGLYSKTGVELDFIETGNWAGGGALTSTANDDGKVRKISDQYKITTISLTDCLIKHSAPFVIDFLSLDTEGSEYEILQSVDFKMFKFHAVCVEHNFVVSKRNKIRDLLLCNGYHVAPFSDGLDLVDDWYFDDETLQKFKDIIALK